MTRSKLRNLGALTTLLALALSAQAAPAQPRKVDLPPSADLVYELSAQQRGFNLKGEALIHWRASAQQYSVNVEASVPLLGKLTEYRSHGSVDKYGLAPDEFYEKRYRKAPTTTSFSRSAHTISFTDSSDDHALEGGEQDRASVTWQLAALARGLGEARFKPGSEWEFVVAGRRDAEPWTFKVVKREKLKTALGSLDTLMVTRSARAGGRNEGIDIWLAPAREWYPVKIRFHDDGRENIEQTITRITPK